MNLHVSLLVGWLVGQAVMNFPKKRRDSHTSMLQSEHLFLEKVVYYVTVQSLYADPHCLGLRLL